MDENFHTFLSSSLQGGWLASCSGTLTLFKTSFGLLNTKYKRQHFCDICRLNVLYGTIRDLTLFQRMLRIMFRRWWVDVTVNIRVKSATHRISSSNDSIFCWVGFFFESGPGHQQSCPEFP